MKCQNCDKAEAVVELTSSLSGKTLVKRMMCNTCARAYELGYNDGHKRR